MEGVGHASPSSRSPSPPSLPCPPPYLYGLLGDLVAGGDDRLDLRRRVGRRDGEPVVADDRLPVAGRDRRGGRGGTPRLDRHAQRAGVGAADAGRPRGAAASALPRAHAAGGAAAELAVDGRVRSPARVRKSWRTRTSRPCIPCLQGPLTEGPLGSGRPQRPKPSLNRAPIRPRRACDSVTTKTLSFIAYGVSCRARAERSRYAAYTRRFAPGPEIPGPIWFPRSSPAWSPAKIRRYVLLPTGGTIAKCPATTSSNTRPPILMRRSRVIDLDAFDRNAADLLRRAGATPIRLASKSVRCRALIDRALGRRAPGDPRLHAARGAVAGRPRPLRPRRRLPHRRPQRAARARGRAVRPRDDHGRLPSSTSTSPWRPCARRAAARSCVASTSTRAGGRSAAASASARGARRCGRPSRRRRSRVRWWPGRSCASTG